MTPTYLWAPPPVRSLPVRGRSERLPVNRLFFVGRNYHAHAVEMGRPVDKTVEVPFYFTKSPDTLVESGATVPYPPQTSNYHHEMELVLVVGRAGFRVPQAEAGALVYGYACGLDMTRRDLQRAMGDEKKPWEIGKSFDKSAPIGPLHPVGQTGHFTQGSIWLKVNGQTKQNANLNQMIWNVAEQISRLSQAFELFPGDIVYSGTPENVGPVVRGDVIDCHIDGLPNLSVKIV